ncbi:unnamed protein product [Boreogadus saida]
MSANYTAVLAPGFPQTIRSLPGRAAGPHRVPAGYSDSIGSWLIPVSEQLVAVLLISTLEPRNKIAYFESGTESRQTELSQTVQPPQSGVPSGEVERQSLQRSVDLISPSQRASVCWLT